MNVPRESPRHWIVKFAPFRTSWAEVVQRGTFTMRGVRSPVARSHLAAMRLGDHALFYHSQQEQAVMGLMEVTREAYPDPTSAEPQWLTCDFRPIGVRCRWLTSRLSPGSQAAPWFVSLGLRWHP